MGNLYGIAEWIGLVLGGLIVAAVLAVFIRRRRLIVRVEAELGRDCVLLVAAARMGFSLKPMEPGLLMLLATGLYFHSWFADRELFIPGPSITYIGVSDARRERHAIVLRFLNTAGKEDGLLIRLLYPEQWVTAIKTHLITRSG
ncbi:MAG: hypothetical protein IMZ69_09785 [Spirochaetes bacterium]|nr:hypothetical protein [Spirochaetota bacterium]